VLFEASLKVTVPVAPIVTVAVKVTAVPKVGVVDEAVNEVVVFAVFIVNVAAFDARKATAVVFALVYHLTKKAVYHYLY
jgi:hypothetical protein